jgi:predicted TIM-barrel fold metal-dependent hydrolase
MERIDAHAHWDVTSGLAEVEAFLKALDLRIVNVCVHGVRQSDWRATVGRAVRTLHERLPERFAWLTTLDYPEGGAPAPWVQRNLAQLREDFAAGAVGVKIWRDVGMQTRKSDGSYLMMDDPLYDPVYDFIAGSGQTLLVHIAEPLERWPSAQRLAQPVGLYRHANRHSLMTDLDCPDYPAQIAARDHVLARFPKMRMVGAHLGSMEHDVRLVAERLERYPNFAVDTSGRRSDLALQDRTAVREFFLRYSDRILWGMDQGATGYVSKVPTPADWEYIWRSNRDGYGFECGLYESDGQVQVDHLTTRGLALPADILRKIYWENARRWYPRMFA